MISAAISSAITTTITTCNGGSTIIRGNGGAGAEGAGVGEGVVGIVESAGISVGGVNSAVFLLFVVLIGSLISVLTCWMESYRLDFAEHWHVGLAMLMISIVSYATWRGNPSDDVYVMYIQSCFG